MLLETFMSGTFHRSWNIEVKLPIWTQTKLNFFAYLLSDHKTYQYKLLKFLYVQNKINVHLIVPKEKKIIICLNFLRFSDVIKFFIKFDF